jgi:hypothetical protein
MVAPIGILIVLEDSPPLIGAQVLLELRRVLPARAKEILPAKLWRKMTFSESAAWLVNNKATKPAIKCLLK